MIRILLFLLPMLLTGIGQAAPGNPTKEERLAIWLKKYPQADINNDGELTEEEVAQFREAAKGNSASDRSSKKKTRIPPTISNIRYGDHERQVFDFWMPETGDSSSPTPILIYFHGGGFVGGDKSNFDPSPYLNAGIACASSNYRFVDGGDNLSNIPLQDAARAVQTIRHRSVEFGVDAGRIALSGSSAGAVIAMWIGYNDELAESNSEDPVARESTRVNCVMPINGPTNLMPSWIIKNIGGAKSVHSSYIKLYGTPAEKPMTSDVEARIKSMSALELVSEDDPPTLLIYSGSLEESLPLPANTSSGKIIHHPYFGKALKAKLDDAGVENELLTNFPKEHPGNPLLFLMTHFSMID